ncbi:MAG: hypothetical protein BMS9Abin12_0837 [Acidimicrobiia bacterium]|nr:MAG: hypothetical protein BMS9Abin12_0837 [Acidimicrobiia bacterium]
MAALGAATLDQRTALSGAHATTEAMLALTAAVIGLVRTLHDEVSLVGEVAVNPWWSRNAGILGGSLEKPTVMAQPAKTRKAPRKTG